MITCLTIVGGAAAIWFFWPVILVEPEFSSPQQGEPLQTRFKITNESPISIYDVTYTTELVDGTKPAGMDDRVTYVDICDCPAQRLSWHASFTGALNVPIPPPIGRTIMQVWVHYRLPFFSRRRAVGYCFHSMRDENGGYHWYPAGEAAEWKAGQLPFLD